MSTRCITCPPRSLPRGLVIAGKTISVISDRDALTGFPRNFISVPGLLSFFRLIPIATSFSYLPCRHFLSSLAFPLLRELCALFVLCVLRVNYFFSVDLNVDRRPRARSGRSLI